MNQKGSAASIIIKTFVIIASILILLSLSIGGYIFYQFRNWEPDPELFMTDSNEIVNLLNDIESNSGIDFTEPETVDVEWREGSIENIVIYSGYEMRAEGITFEEAEKVDAYLESQGYALGPHNAADGEGLSLHGMTNGFTICPIYWEYDPDIFNPDLSSMDLTVSCAEYDYQP